MMRLLAEDEEINMDKVRALAESAAKLLWSNGSTVTINLFPFAVAIVLFFLGKFQCLVFDVLKIIASVALPTITNAIYSTYELAWKRPKYHHSGGGYGAPHLYRSSDYDYYDEYEYEEKYSDKEFKKRRRPSSKSRVRINHF